ncbi:hypothetical protein P280DRAFT_471497 [Massarina eburnea CBS 473.64]|uniref:DUF7580 domain-containing protein n=1 Tax=Massarina eburnea CBS 473.64 TaxID=1395130 RepID=A0A6A6RRW7_9PLEO|nr:hypothetical protein P280DRAFT_471497 [Massarina eburnea CBS 473.64]
MSGFEITGVVLGSIPILVEALKSYADGVSMIKGVFTYEETYLEIHSSLVVSATIFQHSCEELLRGLVLPHSQFFALVETHEGWDNKDLAEKLKKRIGECDFDTYMKFANRVWKRIVLLGEKLQLRKDLTPVFIINGELDPKRRKQFFKSPITRVRGAFEAAKLRKVVEDIANDVRRLRDLSKDALQFEEERQERATASTSAYWLTMRNHALLLFSALQSMWPQCCPLHEHVVNLRVTLAETRNLSEDLATTQLCFHLENNNKAKIQRQVTIISSEAFVPKSTFGAKKARFATPRVVPVPNGHAYCKNERIDDLCDSLDKHCSTECLGYLHIEKWHYHLHGVQEWPQSTDLLPLRKLLASRTRTGVASRERCNYSIQLASAVMQLFDTSWLKQTWTLDDVYVNRKDKGGQIYIPTWFDGRSSTYHASDAMPLFVKNQLVFALGVALLELTYGKEIQYFAKAEDLDKDSKPHNLTMYIVADRLTKEVQETETPGFARAIAKCIYPASDTYDFDLSNEGYGNRFYIDVLQPLEQDHKRLFSP